MSLPLQTISGQQDKIALISIQSHASLDRMVSYSFLPANVAIICGALLYPGSLILKCLAQALFPGDSALTLSELKVLCEMWL